MESSYEANHWLNPSQTWVTMHWWFLVAKSSNEKQRPNKNAAQLRRSSEKSKANLLIISGQVYTRETLPKTQETAIA
nr:hypothetical protein Iba_scaffold569CG0210 [Ipomoea batatas]